MQRIPNKEGICAHIFNVRALDAKQKINFFWPYLSFIWPENGHILQDYDVINE